MKTTLLVIGKNLPILRVLDRLINQNPDRKAYVTHDDDEAIEWFSTNHPDLVLLSSGISEEEELKLREAFQRIDPSVKIIQHYGGGSGLLENEIIQALHVA